MNRQKIFRILFVISLVVFVISCGMLLSYLRVYHEGDSEYQQVLQGAVQVRQTEGQTEEVREDAGLSAGDPESRDQDGAPEEQAKDVPALLIDFDALLEQNPDTVGWIDFPGQDVSYPIVQGDDNDHYLYYTFNGTRNALGSIFLDVRNSGMMSDGNTIIYGHNMKNGSMFGFLKKYQEKEHYEKYPYFDIYVPEGVYRCRIVSAGKILVETENYRLNFTDGQDRQDYIDRIRKTSGYEISWEDEEKPLVLLSTCTGSDHSYRFVVLAQAEEFYPAE